MKKYVLFFLCAGLLQQGCKSNPKNQQGTEKNVTAPAAVAPAVQEKKESVLSGTCTSSDNPFYKSLTFKGKTTVVIKDAILGMDFPTSYERDENYIRIKTDKSDLLLEIVDSKTLVGEGFAEGVFTKNEK